MKPASQGSKSWVLVKHISLSKLQKQPKTLVMNTVTRPTIGQCFFLIYRYSFSGGVVSLQNSEIHKVENCFLSL